MDKKLLMKVGIGAGVLVLGFLAYKKFVAKPKDTKSAEVETEEEEVESETPTKATPVTESVAPTKSQSVKSSVVFTEWEGDSAEIREKFKKAFGITSEDWKKMQEQVKKFFASRRLGRDFNMEEAIANNKQFRKFAEENNIDFEGYLKARKSNQEHIENRKGSKKPVAMGQTVSVAVTPMGVKVGEVEMVKTGGKGLSKRKKFLDREASALEKYGLSKSDVEKLQNENLRIAELQMQNTKLTDDEKRTQRFDVLRKFGKANNLNVEAYIKFLEDKKAKLDDRKAETDLLTGKSSFADFMDFDGNDDVQGSIM